MSWVSIALVGTNLVLIAWQLWLVRRQQRLNEALFALCLTAQSLQRFPLALYALGGMQTRAISLQRPLFRIGRSHT